jgi:ring-1,2-phenylacetyl-CoA epoxidase subunit PaaC
VNDEHNAYEALNEVEESDGHWAFGTGFDDPLAGVDTSLPEGVDGHDLATYCCMLGDDALVLSQRLSQWITHAPELEEEVAIANIALDLLGQARLLLARAGLAEGSGRSEDDLAYLRDPAEFRNVTLAEAPNGDFARSSARLLVLSAHRLAVLERLTASRDPVLAAIAAKGVKELAYHRDWAARWVVRLGDGTDVSRERMAQGLADVWSRIPELFATSAVEARMAAEGVGVDPASVRDDVEAVLEQVLEAATLDRPSVARPEAAVSGRDGRHTDDLVDLLDELQGFARANPGATW